MLGATRKWTLALSLFGCGSLFGYADGQALPTFTAMQVETGAAAYEQSCSRCHGIGLQGGDFAPALLGLTFIQRWSGRPISELMSLIKMTMPAGTTERLTDPVYASIIAYILDGYGLQMTATPLPTEVDALAALRMPDKETMEANLSSAGGGLSSGVSLPKWLPEANPLARITRVTDAMLAAPPEGAWLSWRRTQDDVGFSPLKQITKSNVGSMRVAWSLALPPGPNEGTPLVHDGVLFVSSFGDHVYALDAISGDELWHYHRNLPRGTGPLMHRNLALYDDKVYFATSDARIVALQAKTGRVVWEQPIGNAGSAGADGGPIVVKGVVMQGVTFGALGAFGASDAAGYIVGLDATSGRPIWRFNTVAQPGEPNGNSWNGLPLEKRSGGGVWTAGSYDAESGLAFFGPAPTYDTEPLRKPVDQPGITNDALYTNATVALDPHTGKLAWFYQHLPNDQWDLDWAFERQIVHLTIDGKVRKVIITAGKEAIYDALDAETGTYLFSLDLGLQNLITKIDRNSGKKSIDPKLVPGDGNTVTVCPHSLGAKNWLPASYDPTGQILYVPLVESCMDMIPIRKKGVLTSGVQWTLRPRADSDGKFGRLQAVNVETRRTVWTKRQRAPQTTGVLATAGGIVFAGALDRWFTAYSADTGKSLWKVRLSDVPNSAPISYLAGRKQYVAIVVGHGGPQSVAYLPLVPEIRLPTDQSSAIWVFELPD